MLMFLLGLLSMYSMLSSFLVVKLYQKNSKKCTKEEIEDYLLDNFLEVDIDV